MVPLRKPNHRLLGLAHFAVDLICTALLAARLADLAAWQVLAGAILYNGLAFAFQLPVGALADRLALSRDLAAWGCLLVAVGALLPWPLALCLLTGLGNACFHIGGGRQVLLQSGSAAGAVGRFVAPGALGIFLGPRLAAAFPGQLGLLLPGLLALTLGLYHTRQKEAPSPTAAPKGFRLRTLAACGCMFLTVLLRSYLGTVLSYPFLGSFLPALLFSLCIFAGKFFGGTLADRFGHLPFSALAQGLCVPAFVLSVWMPWLALPAIFLFNTSMAITAASLYRTMPQYPGTMFGLTTFALYLGVLPRLLGWESPFFTWWGLGILSLLSAVSLTAGLWLMKGGPSHGGAP